LVWYICKIYSDNRSSRSLFQNVLITDFFLTKLSSHSQFGNSFFQLTSKIQLPCIILEMICCCKIQKSLSSLHSWVLLTHSRVIVYFSDSTVSETSRDAVNTVLISGIPSTFIKEAGNSLHAELTRQLQSRIQNIWVYGEKRLAVVKVDSSESVGRILQVHTSTLKCFLYTLSMYEDSSVVINIFLNLGWGTSYSYNSS
jgi:hypothetical protein